LSAAIYVSLARIISVYGYRLSRFSPKTYTITFVSCDITALVIQSVGGAIASIANTTGFLDTGVHIMDAGLIFQVISLAVFIALWAGFLIALKRSRSTWTSEKDATLLQHSMLFIIIMSISCLIRSRLATRSMQATTYLRKKTPSGENPSVYSSRVSLRLAYML